MTDFRISRLVLVLVLVLLIIGGPPSGGFGL